MIIIAKTQEAYKKALNLPLSIPLNNGEISIDSDYFEELDPSQYIILDTSDEIDLE